MNELFASPDKKPEHKAKTAGNAQKPEKDGWQNSAFGVFHHGFDFFNWCVHNCPFINVPRVHRKESKTRTRTNCPVHEKWELNAIVLVLRF